MQESFITRFDAKIKSCKNIHLIAVLFILSFILLSIGSSLLPVTDPVESNYALTAKEMVLSGNWMSPQIYGVFWFDKPIMIYWLLSVSYSIFGFTNFASRLPSIIFGAISVPLLYYYVSHILKDKQIAFYSGIMLLTSFEFWLISHGIITDAVLLMFTIPTLFSAYIGIKNNNIKHMLIAYGAAGFACLTKGPVGLVLPGLFLLIWCGLMRSSVYLKRCFPWQGIILFLIVVLPWYGGMYLIHGQDFINGFLGIHNVLRATSSEHPSDNHWYYYLVVLPLSLLPWFGLTVYQAIKEWKEKTDLYLFLMTWLLGTFFFYTLMATKYITYTYIAVIPGIVLAAKAIESIKKGSTKAYICLSIPFFILTVAMGYLTTRVHEVNWTFMYFIIILSIVFVGLFFKKNLRQGYIYVSTFTLLMYISMILQGLPVYMNTRAPVFFADEFKNLPGKHYFFDTYSTSYVYYTSDLATRIKPSIALATNVESRNSLWDFKFIMPTISDNEFENEKLNESAFVFVYNKNADAFKNWKFYNHFVPVKKFDDGTIYKLVTIDELSSHNA